MISKNMSRVTWDTTDKSWKLSLVYTFSKIYDLSTSDSEQALSHYARMIRPKIREMFPKGEDGTTIINGTIFVNEKGEPNHTQKNLFKEVIKEFFDYGQEFGSFKNIDKTKLINTNNAIVCTPKNIYPIGKGIYVLPICSI